MIGEITENQTHTLSIGLTSERGIEMFMDIYPDFYKEYPNITVFPHEVNSKTQLEMIQNDQLDIGFVTFSTTPSGSIECVPIIKDELVLVIPATHPYAQYASPPGEPLAMANLSNFKDDTFVLMFKQSTQRSVIDPLFAEAGYKPKMIMETASNRTLYFMVRNGLCCSILPRYYARFDPNIRCFHITDTSWWVYAINKKSRYIGKAAKRLIKLATQYYKKLNSMHL